MKKTNVISVIILLTIIGCSTTKNTPQNELKIKFQDLDLKSVIELEEELNSTDISPEYRIELGDGIYPNTNNYKFEVSRTYRRIIKPSFSLEVDYHFTEDSLIRVILYEWNELKKGNEFSFKSDKENLKTKKKFDKKFSDLRKRLNTELGEPSFIEIGSNKAEQTGTYRNEVKWLNSDRMNCYLFGFSDKEGTYNQIRLAIYPD